MSKKLFIFDLDGVLVEACDWHRDALNEALLEASDCTITQQEHIKIFNGIPTRKKLSILLKQNRIKERDIEKIYELKQKYTIKTIKKQATVRDEKIEMLNFLKERGHTVACYTNSIRETAELMLKKTGIYDLFDYILTNQDVKEPKPSAEGYNFLIRYYDVNKKMCYIIEDSPKGIAAASNSGANVICVKNADDVNIDTIRSFV
jgi:HAD superfamily hydrolase (TIGR01509 family)